MALTIPGFAGGIWLGVVRVFVWCVRSFRWHLLCQEIELWIRFFVKVCLCGGMYKVFYEMKCFFLFVYFYVQTFLVCALCVYVCDSYINMSTFRRLNKFNLYTYTCILYVYIIYCVLYTYI